MCTGSVQQASYLGYQAPRVILPQSGTTTQPLLQATGLGNQHLQYNSQVCDTSVTVHVCTYILQVFIVKADRFYIEINLSNLSKYRQL